MHEYAKKNKYNYIITLSNSRRIQISTSYSLFPLFIAGAHEKIAKQIIFE